MFVNVLMLGALGALSIPVVIHLIKSRRFKPALIGTLRFLREALRETAAHRRLHNLLLLLLRLLAVAAAVLLFARPLWRTDLVPENGRTLLVLVDASGSMNARGGGEEGPRHFELAGRRVRQLAAEAGPGAHVRVLLMGDEVREAGADEVAEGFQKVIPAGQANWAAGLRRAAGLLDTCAPGDRRLLILTDLQKTDLPRPGAAEAPNWPAQTRVDVVSLAAPDWNAKVASVTRCKSGPNGVELNVAVEVRGEAPRSATWPLEVRIDGKLAARVGVPSVSGTTRVAIPASALKPRPDQTLPMAQVRLQSGDCLPEDNLAWLPVALPHPSRAWLVGTPAAGSRFDGDGYFLDKALGVVPAEGEAPAFTVLAAQVQDGRLQPVDASAKTDPAEVFVLADCGPGLKAALPSLVARVKAGAGCVLFLGAHADPETCGALAACGLLPAAPRPVAASDPQSVVWWEASHPAFAGFDPDRLDLAALNLKRLHDLAPLVKVGAKPLMKLEDEAVAMVETSCGKGRVLVVAAGPTRQSSDWVTQRAFAPLVRAWAIHAAATLSEAGGWKVAVRKFTDEAGFGPDLNTHRILVFPGNESDLAAADEASFRTAWRMPAKQAEFNAADLAPKMVPPDGFARPHEIWPILALLLLLILTVETLVADRRTSR